ncbi:3-dehydroquinate synthase [Flavobacterium caeni]|nr:3-dehydroquinate synthase [Flavobacterium caeni]
MQSIPANGYAIHFGDTAYDLLNAHIAAQHYSSIFILADTQSNEYCVPRLLPLMAVDIPIEIVEFESGESAKTIDTCVQLWTLLTELGADRKSLILNVGGGVVTDLGGFVASTFKRGIDFIHIPTTLLAMVDASVGGKNGVDLGHLKNQIGVIRTPQMVLIDTQFLETLPQNEMRSGLAEMLKHGLIFDKDYWAQFLDLQAVDFADFDALVWRSIEIKNQIVMQDPTENGIRKALNFGHTLGHAIESYFLESPDKTTLLHGEAIAAGMVLEAFLSREKNLVTPQEYAQIKYVLTDIFGKLDFAETDLEPIIALLVHDKKNEYGHIQFALLDGIGKIKTNQSSDNELIRLAFADYKS